MKKYFMVLVCIALAFATRGQGIRFESNRSWQQIKAKAKSEHKLIFIDAFATWCVPCKELSTKTFPDTELGAYVNENFVSVKVQMDQTKNDNDNVNNWRKDAKAIERKFQLQAFPTIFMLSPDGEMVHKVEGFLNPKDLIVQSKLAASKFETFRILESKYQKGQRDSAFMKDFAYKTWRMGRKEHAQQIADEFINSLSDSEIFASENIRFVYAFTNSSKDKFFNICRTQSMHVNEALKSEVAAQAKVRNLIGKEEIEPYLNATKNPDWEKIERNIKSKYEDLGMEAYYGYRMTYASQKENWEDYGKYYGLYYTTAYNRSSFHINNMSWPIFEHVDDPKILAVALATMKYVIGKYDKLNPQAYDTYANLLYKTGKKAEAIEWEEKAIQLNEELALKDGATPDPSFKQTLEKMKRGEVTWIVQKTQ